MAKTSAINKQRKREKLVRRFAAKRAELKKVINHPDSAPEAIDEAILHALAEDGGRQAPRSGDRMPSARRHTTVPLPHHR